MKSHSVIHKRSPSRDFFSPSPYESSAFREWSSLAFAICPIANDYSASCNPFPDLGNERIPVKPEHGEARYFSVTKSRE
jgi:hypothetical protein